jgi:hypothetical protein
VYPQGRQSRYSNTLISFNPLTVALDSVNGRRVGDVEIIKANAKGLEWQTEFGDIPAPLHSRFAKFLLSNAEHLCGLMRTFLAGCKEF